MCPYAIASPSSRFSSQVVVTLAVCQHPQPAHSKLCVCAHVHTEGLRTQTHTRTRKRNRIYIISRLTPLLPLPRSSARRVVLLVFYDVIRAYISQYVWLPLNYILPPVLCWLCWCCVTIHVHNNCIIIINNKDRLTQSVAVGNKSECNMQKKT